MGTLKITLHLSKTNITPEVAVVVQDKSLGLNIHNQRANLSQTSRNFPLLALDHSCEVALLLSLQVCKQGRNELIDLFWVTQSKKQ